MMEVLELVTPPPVQISNSPASFMRNSYSPSGNGKTRSNFCRSTQNCASPGLSPVSLPISYIVTTTTLTAIGLSATSLACALDSACAFDPAWALGSACTAGSARSGHDASIAAVQAASIHIVYTHVA